MFAVGLIIGIYAYIIFALGVAGLLYDNTVMAVSVVFLMSFTAAVVIYRNRIAQVTHEMYQLIMKDKLSLLTGSLLLLLALIYGAGALIPERAYDALWYHLTLPKIFLEYNRMLFIPGELLYYSVMPKLIDMLYISALVIHDEILAKVIHFGFGVLTVISVYLLARKIIPVRYALLASLIYYSNIVVGWESTTAYIDLGRTFFELLAFWTFINYVETKKKVWFVESAVMLGLAISAKLIAVSSFVIFIPLIFITLRNEMYIHRLRMSGIYSAISMLVVSPWLIFAYLTSGNPVYPLFSQYYSPTQGMNLPDIISELWKIFVRADDPISPLYIIVLPLLYFVFKKLTVLQKTVVWYCLFAIIAWTLLPKTGGGRFMMVYLPVLSVAAALVISKLKDRVIIRSVLIMIFILAVLTAGYRSLAQMHALPYLLGQQTKQEYLSAHLNFRFGDFYDVDNYFAQNISSEDRVLVYGVHHLYYIDFPFVHVSYVQPGDEFNYILVGENKPLPERFKHWTLVYENEKTGVQLYTFGEQRWIY